MTTPTQGEHAQTAAQVQRYKIGYPTGSWGERSSTPSGIPDFAGTWVRYADHAAELRRLHAQVAALTAAPGVKADLRQILLDPENQPNQYGVQFLMHGPKMAFKIGNRQFCLDYEPTEPGEFEFMRDALIATFSVFTPDVKTPAQPAEGAARASHGQAPAGAAPELCPYCNGSGDTVVMDSAGPDAQEVPANCPHCKGSGLLADAYQGVVELLKKKEREYLACCAKLYVQPPSSPTAQAAPASVLHLVHSAFAEIAMAFPKAFALHKVGIADTAVRETLAAPALGAVAGPVVPPEAITASVMRDDGGEQPAFCLMAAYRSEKDAMDALAMLAAAPTPAAQTDSQPAPQGETNVQLDIDSNHSTPGQQRDVAGSVALGQPMGNGQDQAAGHPSAQGDKLLTVAERNIRSFLRSAIFKSESDREAALSCVDVLYDAARKQGANHD